MIRKHYENPTTELLEFFLTPQELHGLGGIFGKGFSDVVIAQFNDSKTFSLGDVETLERECATHDDNRIDLFISTDSHLILLEVKIYHEQNNPFDNYVKYAQSRANSKTILGVILSTSGKVKSMNG